MTEEQVYAVLQQLAEQFQTTVSHLWGVMIRQAYVEGISILITSILCLVFIRYVVTNSPRLLEMASDRDVDRSMVGIGGLVGGWITSLFAAGYVFFNINNLLTALFNPEYWILQQIFNLLGG